MNCLDLRSSSMAKSYSVLLVSLLRGQLHVGVMATVNEDTVKRPTVSVTSVKGVRAS